MTRAQLLVFLAALAQAGSCGRDRVEHGAVVPGELLGELDRLGVSVVTQPNFVAERGDRYLVDVDHDDVAHMYRCGSLMATGIAVAAGTDAPFGGSDPWAAMRAAVERTTESGAILGGAERVGALTAMRLFQGWPDRPGLVRRIEPGGPADLCVLRVPLRAALAALSSSLVAATITGGQIIYQSA